MLRTEGFTPQTKTVNFMLLDGGLGDHCASLIAVDYVCKNYPWVTPLVWVPDYLIDFSKHLLPKDLYIKGFGEMRGKYQPKRPTKTTHWDGHTSAMKIHCVDYAFLKLCDELPGIIHKNYLQIKPKELNVKHSLPDKYVVITTGYTAKVREFLPQHVNKTAEYIKSKGYEVIFLGQKVTKTGGHHTITGNFNTEINYTAGIDLLDKTSLLEAAFIMSNAAAVVGIDNGLLHVAGCTQTPIIGGFTTVKPEVRLPIRNNMIGFNYYPVVPNESLKCRFCQVNTNFLYGHDYKECMYKDYECTKQLTADKFILELEKIL